VAGAAVCICTLVRDLSMHNNVCGRNTDLHVVRSEFTTHTSTCWTVADHSRTYNQDPSMNTRGRFWATLEETSWVGPGHTPT
jgi:hypothetical protein